MPLTADAGDRFGASVSVSADGARAVVGAPFRDVLGSTDRGEAYVFVRSGGVWSLEATLTQSTLAAGDRFGRSVAMSGDGTRVLVGADLKDAGRGAAWIYHRVGSTWTEEARLVPSRAAGGDTFGYAVALDATGGRAVVGAPLLDEVQTNVGGAFVFSRTGSAWAQEGLLIAGTRAAGDGVGDAVAISATGDRVMLGASLLDDGGVTNCGGAYVYRRGGTTWVEEARVVASDREAGELAGQFVSLSADGSVALMSVRQDTVGGVVNAGSLRVLTRSATSWGAEEILTASAPQANAYFGGWASLASDGGFALAAADQEDDLPGVGANVGAVYLFSREASGWGAGRRTLRATRMAGELFGNGAALAADGGTAVVGSSNLSFATALRIGLADGDGCSVERRCLSDLCVDGVCCATSCGGGLDDCLACSVAMGGSSDGTCTPRVSGAVCRPASGACDAAEVCDGAGAACPIDAAMSDGTSCANATVCDGAERCASGVCIAGAPPSCDDGDPCTADACDALSGCASTSIAGCTGDAGALDAGEGDAGADDAGASDGGLRDGGPLDGGPFDGGPFDAGPFDGGLRDASLDGASDDVGLGPERIDLRCTCAASPPLAAPRAVVAVLVLIGIGLLRRKRRVALALATLVLLMPTSASAQPDDREAQALYELATVHYRDGRFEEAASEYQRAFEISGRGELLYNTYLSWREAGRSVEAATALRGYLASDAEIDPEQRHHLERRLEALDASIAAGADAEASTVDASTSEAPTAEDRTAEPPLVETLTLTPADRGEGLSLAPGGVVLGVGLLTLIAAGVEGIVALVIAQDHASACSLGANATRCPAGYDQDAVVSSFHLHRDLGWGLLGAGLGVSLVGAILLGIGATDDPPIIAACGPTGCDLNLTGHF